MAESSDLNVLKRQMAMLEKQRIENDKAMAQIRERMFKATSGRKSTHTTMVNTAEPQPDGDDETTNAAVSLQELAQSQRESHTEERPVSATVESAHRPRPMIADPPESQTSNTFEQVKPLYDPQNTLSTSPRSTQKPKVVHASVAQTQDNEEISSVGHNLPSIIENSAAQRLFATATTPTSQPIHGLQPSYSQHTLPQYNHTLTHTQTAIPFGHAISFNSPYRERCQVTTGSQGRLIPQNSLRNVSFYPSSVQSVPMQAQVTGSDLANFSTQHALFASQMEAQQRAQFKQMRNASLQQSNDQGQAGVRPRPIQYAPGAAIPHSRGQLSPSLMYHFQTGQVPISHQAQLNQMYQQQYAPIFSAHDSQPTPSISFNTGSPLNIGKSRLTKKSVPAIHRQQSTQQVNDTGSAGEASSQLLGTAKLGQLSARRERSPSIMIMDEGPAKRQHQEEDSRVITPPLNENEAPTRRAAGSIRKSGSVRTRQQATSSAQRSQHAKSTARKAIVHEETDECGTTLQVSKRQTQRHTQGHSPPNTQSNPSTDIRLVLPQPRPQAYALHIQQRATQSRSSSTSTSTSTSPPTPDTNINTNRASRHTRKPSSTHSITTSATKNNHNHQSKNLRPRRAAATLLHPDTYKIPQYRRLTPAERSELELRYCAHLARHLCSNTCVTLPPYPLSAENLWTRISRRFPPEPSHSPPENYDSRETYHSALDFEADVKAMLKQYVLMGHCGEQAQRLPNGKEVNVKCEFDKTGNARVMCWRMRLEAVLDDKIRDLRMRLRECEEGYVAEDMEGKRGCIDGAFSGVRLGE